MILLLLRSEVSHCYLVMNANALVRGRILFEPVTTVLLCSEYFVEVYGIGKI